VRAHRGLRAGCNDWQTVTGRSQSQVIDRPPSLLLTTTATGCCNEHDTTRFQHDLKKGMHEHYMECINQPTDCPKFQIARPFKHTGAHKQCKLPCQKLQPLGKIVFHSCSTLRCTISLGILYPLPACRCNAIFPQLKVSLDKLCKAWRWAFQSLEDGPMKCVLSVMQTTQP